MKRSLECYILISLLLIFSAVSYAIQGPTTTYCNLSVGKFYTYNLTPNASYSDRWGNKWTDGARLTDEELGQNWPLTEWMGWFSGDAYTLEIVLDLGKVNSVDLIRLNTCSRLGYGIEYPVEVRFYYRQSSSDQWQMYGGAKDPGANTQGYSPVWIEEQGDAVDARYIKFELDGPASAHMFVSEIEVYGDYLNSWKNVPDWGCIHGAYPSNTQYYMSIGTYENVTQKPMSMALWYANMGASNFKDYLGGLWRSQYGLSYNIDYQGARYLEVGWEPEGYITAEDVASGYYDSYFETFFLESIDYSNRGGNMDPVWLRPMSEMNGGWTFVGNAAAWGGDPLNFRRAWRRMFNAAEQVGADTEHIFLWSPNGYTYNGEDHMPDKYYPGDQYVDWVGLSLYVQGTVPYPNNLMTGTAGVGSFDFYSNYSYKPMMISEGAFRPKDGVDGEEWMRQWFALPENFPMIKCMVWFYIHDADYNVLISEPYQSLCREEISDLYFLRQSVAGRVDIDGDFEVNLNDFSRMVDHWMYLSSNLDGDINGDNALDVDDLMIFAEYWLN